MPVGKLVFKRGLMGRMVKQRANILETGIISLDFKEVKENFEARCCGEEEKVREALSIMIELAEGCGFVPGKPNSLVFYRLYSQFGLFSFHFTPSLSQSLLLSATKG